MAAMGCGLKPTTDAVMLAAAADVGPGASVFDAGCGAGAVALCLLARLPDLRVAGMEREPELAALAARNVALNGVEGLLSIVCGDLADGDLCPGPFDAVVTNPPYLEERAVRVPSDHLRAAAMVETMPLGDWVAACIRRVRTGGVLYLVHRPERRREIEDTLVGLGCGAAVIPLLPRAGAREPERILVRATVTAAQDGVIDASPMVLHESGGRYTVHAEAVLRDGEPIDWF